MSQKEEPIISQSETKLKISCSGFEHKTKKVFEQFIVKLGATYTDTLQLDTNILITGNVLSDKYRGACILNIPVVTSDWLVQSNTQKKFLPTDYFKIPFFKGLTIGILGFSADEIEEIKKIISENHGEHCTNLAKIQEGKDMNLIVIKSTEIKRYESFIFSLPIPVVSIDWLKQCIISSQYIKPGIYAVNVQKNNTRQSASQRTNETLNSLQRIEAHLNKVLNENDVNDDRWNYLEKAVVYFHNMTGKLEKLQKKLIDAGGGFYVDEIIPDVTHIVTEDYYETDIKTFNAYKEVKVVNPLWLKDCLLFQRLAKEDDYILQPGPQPEPILNSQNSNSMNALTRRNTLTNSQSNEDLSKILKKLPSIQETKREHKIREGKDRSSSISGIASSSNVESHKDKDKTSDRKKKSDEKEKVDSKLKKKPVPIKGYVFRNINIYFDPTIRHLSHYKRLVEENSGRVLDHRNVFEEIFCVFSDSPDSIQMMKKKGKNERFVSFRWIDYCLKNKMVVKEIQQKKLVHLCPFPVHLPISEFRDKVVYCAGFSPYDKQIMKEVIEVLGAKFSYDGNLSVLVCADHKSKKVTEIKQSNPDIPIVKEDWIFECINTGKFAETNSFLF